MKAVVAVDFDDTLVDFDTQEWLPGAVAALRSLRRQGYTVVIHSARAGYEQGREQIRAKLATATFKDVRVEAKLHANHYIDNHAIGFRGDWPAVLRELREGTHG